MDALFRGALFASMLWLVPLSGVAAAESAGWPASITIGTASPGGAYYLYGLEVARILSRSLGIETNAQVTQGPAQNIVLLERREAMLGFITTGAGLQGWNGAEWAKGTQYRSMRVIFPMYDTAFQFVARKGLGIKSLIDFAGRQIGVGPQAGTGGVYVPVILKALAITASLRHGAFDDMQTQAATGKLDGVVFVGGIPFPALAELDAMQPIDFIQPSVDEVAVIRKQIPELSPSSVPARTYPSLVEEYRTFGLYNFAVAHKDLPDDLVYKIVKVVFDNHDELVKAYPGAKETVPANIGRNAILPLHPGAIRYYREVGINIPPTALIGN